MVVFATTQAQQLLYKQGEILVQLKSDVQSQDFEQKLNKEESRSSITKSRTVIPTMNIHKYKFDFATIDENDLLREIRTMDEVAIAQFNHFLEKRETTPNDSLFDRQWQYINTGQLNGSLVGADMDMDLAWDITTGGVTKRGDTIVVCVIDDGIDFDHPDFEGNIWYNYAEIPDNGIDDDNNGFVDDFRGWNTAMHNDDAQDRFGHGTAVCGIVGARGNNRTGITGVSWHVKIMAVSGGTGVEDEVLEAYSFPLTHRKRFNETGGAEGSLVVATNASWGVNNGMPSDAPLWCAVYDSLGQEGIINACATANSNVNVDVDGDLPTACTSDYIIAVTNINEADEKVDGAGFGVLSIDLGSYGANTYTTRLDGSYRTFGGTSGATPQVAGAVGLMYAIDCDALNDLYINDPAAAALQMKAAVMNSTLPLGDLQGITVTGGKLNVKNALDYLLANNCGPCPNVTSLTQEEQVVDGMTLSWINGSNTQNIKLRYRPTNGPDWTERSVGNVSEYSLTNLDVCQDYEIQVKSICLEDSSSYSPSRIFRTDGCCQIPLINEGAVITPSSILIDWTSVTAATQYDLRYRQAGVADWVNTTSSANSKLIDDLLPCQEYIFQLKSICTDSASSFSSEQRFSTTGCGSCTSENYCSAGGDSEFEWVESFSLGAFNHVSGNNSGYLNFTQAIGPEVEQNQSYEVSIVHGYMGSAANESYGLWIDLNQDEIFSEDEKLIDTVARDDRGITAQITIPKTATLGVTRLRLAVYFLSNLTPCPPANRFGEYEDYCLLIDKSSGTNTVNAGEIKISTFPNPSLRGNQIQISGDETKLNDIKRFAIYDGSGKLIQSPVDYNQDAQIGQNLETGLHFIHLIMKDGSRKVIKHLVL